MRKLLILLILFLNLTCDSPEIVVPPTHTYTFSQNETELLNIINIYRQSVGLNILNHNQHISYICWEHNIYMINNEVINHDYFQQRADNLILVLKAERVGENIAYNYITPQSALSAWIGSPGHKANIEGNYTDFGVSITRNETTNRNYYTLILIKR